MNCRSIRNKSDEFSSLVDMSRPTVVLGSESWLDAEVADDEVFPRGFACYRKDRNRFGGGVFILVDAAVCSREIDIKCSQSEMLWVEILLENGRSLSVCSFYRPPGSKVNVLGELADAIDTVSTDYLFIGGDFNLPEINWTLADPSSSACSQSSKEMFTICRLFELTQLVLEPTRATNVLDLLFTNTPESARSTVVLPGISDHQAVLCDINLQYVRVANGNTRRIYSYQKARVSDMSLALDSYYDTFETQAEFMNMEELWKIFKSKMLEMRERYVPSWVLTARRSKSKPWFSRDVKRRARQRAHVYAAYKKKPSLKLKDKLKQKTDDMKAALKSAKNQFFNTFHLRIQKRPKELWQFFKMNRKDILSIPALDSNGSVIHNDVEKAECFISFFSSVYTARIKTHNTAARSTVVVGEQMSGIMIDQRGIEAAIKSLNASKSTGPDGLSPALLSLCPREISKYLCIIFAKSLEEISLPDDWKLANVVPVHKGGPRSSVLNYRPISLTSVACKILEHVLFTNVMSHMNVHSLLSPWQHGFRSGFSCTTQLLELTHDLAVALDKGFSVDCLFLDFKKAFDVVPHSLLIEKLEMYNVNSMVVSWIKEYLNLRKQKVVLNGKTSREIDVSSGVPQGSVIGPLLFLIYINDICSGISSQIRLFADDCVLYRVIHNTHDCSVLQNDLEKISEWCTKWHMLINLKKNRSYVFFEEKNTS